MTWIPEANAEKKYEKYERLGEMLATTCLGCRVSTPERCEEQAVLLGKKITVICEEENARKFMY